jgi:hypothetical protein
LKSLIFHGVNIFTQDGPPVDGPPRTTIINLFIDFLYPEDAMPRLALACALAVCVGCGRPTPNLGPSPTEQGTEEEMKLAADIAAQPFWEVARTTKDVLNLADTLCRQPRKVMVCFGPDAYVKVEASPKRLQELRDAASADKDPTGKGGACVDLAQIKARPPTRIQALTAIKAAIADAEKRTH